MPTDAPRDPMPPAGPAAPAAPAAPPSDDPRALELALRITDDAPVDWEATRQTASDLSETLERLRQLQALGELHKRRPAEAPDKPAFTWGSLRAIEKIGEGAFGEVWRAWDPSLERAVALKLRRAGESPAGAQPWLREAQRLARVRHAHVLTVHGTDIHDGRAGIWTELIHGRTLEQLLVERGPMGAREVAGVGLDLCAALAAVHDAGLVHGDIKTRNVMREGTALGEASAAGAGRIVLMDFGTATPRARGGGAPTGATPLFAAPERLAGAPASVASDVYALGVLLYRLASGRFPVEAASLAELEDRLARRELTPLRTWRPDLPGALVHVIDRALAYDPGERFASAAEMERSLAAVFAPAAGASAGDGAARWRLASGVLIGVLLAGAAWATFGAVHDRLVPRFHMATAAAAPPFVLTEPVPDTLIDQWGGSGSLGLGDMDGDGHPDIATSASYERGKGCVRVLFGDGSGGFPRRLTLEGERGGEMFGAALATGDLNHDGWPDLVISAPSRGGPEPARGAVSVLFGGPGMDGRVDLVIPAPHAHGAFGYAVSCGDWNGDGTADLAVGANADAGGGTTPTGRVYVYFGGPRLRATPDVALGCDAPDANFGSSVDLGGDLNGDGIADLAVGAQWESTDGMRAGRTYVYYGGRPPSSRPGLVLHGPGAWHLFGPARFVGDLDEDGFDDLLVTDEHGDGFEHAAGAALLYRGSNTPSDVPALTLRGEHEGDGFGRWAAAGDFDGDGHRDLAVGAWWSDAGGPTSGSVYLYRGGPRLGSAPVLCIPGPAPEARFGTALANAGDLDGDGFPELLIGAPSRSRTAPGGQYMASFHRYVLTRPRPDEAWTRGRDAVVSWRGATPAKLEWSSDGAHWQPWMARAGGRGQNVLRVRVPGAARDSVRVRVSAADARLGGAAVSGAIAVTRAR